ncbi:dihydroorotase [Azospirillum picis]|uniref:Dihydroorotase n=1 Tax=Azospirillum picis TaxID=488438 RepID=A0ABU0MH56_9PROT|nr:dihydroorotase [Azospirillum picis]MBP2298390.1 dihydroorotase [Azospirillum picis]MDQ0532561.1 dihydroorotase [Azospirillum picis]
MNARVVYRNARLLDPATGLDQQADLLTDGETIADFGPGLFSGSLPEGAEVVDLAGLCLAPGLVDIRVLIGEPGEEEKDTIKSASRAAAAGGITAMALLPNTSPVLDEVAGLEFVARRAREVKLVKVFAYAAATRGTNGNEITEMGLLARAGAVAFTDGTKAIASAKTMRRALGYAKTFDKLIVQHPEEPSLASGGMMNSGEIATRLGLVGIPREAEIIMIERDLRLVELTGGRLHFAHVTTGESVELIRRAKARGLRVTCDTAPHYFALTETDVGDYRTYAKVAPPLRGEMDRRAIVEGLADGTIDAIASDHVPQDQDQKRLPFAQAACGVIGLETLFPLVLELVHKGKMPLLKALACVTSKPAGILDLPVGRIAKGGPADLVAFDVDTPWQIDVTRFQSKSKNSPFENRPVQGRPLRTIVDGRTVWQAEG